MKRIDPKNNPAAIRIKRSRSRPFCITALIGVTGRTP
jgi:hypothetical protein